MNFTARVVVDYELSRASSKPTRGSSLRSAVCFFFRITLCSVSITYKGANSASSPLPAVALIYLPSPPSPALFLLLLVHRHPPQPPPVIMPSSSWCLFCVCVCVFGKNDPMLLKTCSCCCRRRAAGWIATYSQLTGDQPRTPSHTAARLAEDLLPPSLTSCYGLSRRPRPLTDPPMARNRENTFQPPPAPPPPSRSVSQGARGSRGREPGDHAGKQQRAASVFLLSVSSLLSLSSPRPGGGGSAGWVVARPSPVGGLLLLFTYGRRASAVVMTSRSCPPPCPPAAHTTSQQVSDRRGTPQAGQRSGPDIHLGL